MGARRRATWGSAALALACVVLAARPSFAQLAPEVAAARSALIDRAYEAAQRSDPSRALELAARAGELQWSASLRGFVAEQQHALGQFAAALGSAELCVQGAERDLAMSNRDVYLARCRALVASLRTRVGHVVVHAPQPSPNGLRISVGGRELPRALWDVPYVVTPGAVEIEAAAPGFEPFRAMTDVTAGGESTVTVLLTQHAPTVDTSACPPGQARRDGQCVALVPAAQPAPVGSTVAPNRERTDRSGPLRTLGWTGVGLGGGLVLAGLALNLYELSVLARFRDNGCWVPIGGQVMGGTNCLGDYAAISTSTALSLAGYVSGGVTAVVGVALLILSPRRGTRPDAPVVTASGGRTHWQVQLGFTY